MSDRWDAAKDTTDFLATLLSVPLLIARTAGGWLLQRRPRRCTSTPAHSPAGPTQGSTAAHY